MALCAVGKEKKGVDDNLPGLEGAKASRFFWFRYCLKVPCSFITANDLDLA